MIKKIITNIARGGVLLNHPWITASKTLLWVNGYHEQLPSVNSMHSVNVKRCAAAWENMLRENDARLEGWDTIKHLRQQHCPGNFWENWVEEKRRAVEDREEERAEHFDSRRSEKGKWDRGQGYASLQCGGTIAKHYTTTTTSSISGRHWITGLHCFTACHLNKKGWPFYGFANMKQREGKQIIWKQGKISFFLWLHACENTKLEYSERSHFNIFKLRQLQEPFNLMLYWVLCA